MVNVSDSEDLFQKQDLMNTAQKIISNSQKNM
jgi:hypothetical protein